jgi:hypothetical protein
MVLGFSRLIWARLVVHQDLQSVLRCHVAAFTAIGGAPREILYDRMMSLCRLKGSASISVQVDGSPRVQTIISAYRIGSRGPIL